MVAATWRAVPVVDLNSLTTCAVLPIARSGVVATAFVFCNGGISLAALAFTKGPSCDDKKCMHHSQLKKTTEKPEKQQDINHLFTKKQQQQKPEETTKTRRNNKNQKRQQQNQIKP